MEQRITLISDPTDEFPNNTNNSFRTRIPNGLRLEGSGWHVALLSLTLPNSTGKDNPFNMNAKKQILRVGYTMMELHTKSGNDYTDSNLYAFSDTIVADADLRHPATTGVGYWTHLIDILEETMQMKVERKRSDLVTSSSGRNPFQSYEPYVLLKRTMRPAFGWNGDELILESAGGDTGHVTSSSTTIYSYFDMSLEVAMQWGFLIPAPPNADTPYLIGPNCSYNMDNAVITDSDPPRTSGVAVDGISDLKGKAYHPQERPDHPAHLAQSQSAFSIIWSYSDSGAVWVRFSRSVEWHFHGLNKSFVDIHSHPSKAVLVYTNLQQSTIVGGSKAQLLRELVVRRGTDHGEHTYTEPLHLQWVPVSTHQTDIVEVQLANVNGNLSSLPKGKSLVTLALKQMV